MQIVLNLSHQRLYSFPIFFVSCATLLVAQLYKVRYHFLLYVLSSPENHFWYCLELIRGYHNFMVFFIFMLFGYS